MVRDLKREGKEFVTYNNFQKLRYHGLIAPITRMGQKVKGRWLITRNGWSFLRGEIELPKYVIVKDNHITSRADQLVNIKHLLHGEPIIQTTFDYFSDDGKPIGFRPAALINRQASLL